MLQSRHQRREIGLYPCFHPRPLGSVTSYRQNYKNSLGFGTKWREKNLTLISFQVQLGNWQHKCNWALYKYSWSPCTLHKQLWDLPLAQAAVGSTVCTSSYGIYAKSALRCIQKQLRDLYKSSYGINANQLCDLWKSSYGIYAKLAVECFKSSYGIYAKLAVGCYKSSYGINAKAAMGSMQKQLWDQCKSAVGCLKMQLQPESSFDPENNSCLIYLCHKSNYMSTENSPLPPFPPALSSKQVAKQNYQNATTQKTRAGGQFYPLNYEKGFLGGRGDFLPTVLETSIYKNNNYTVVD